eukprot:jgi/Tetstr1/422673/TSEL_013471.t1
MAQASYIAFKPSTACGGRLTPAEVRRRSARCTASALAGLQTSPEFAAWDGARRRRARLWRACKFGVALAAALAVLPLAVLALATLEAPAASPHQGLSALSVVLPSLDDISRLLLLRGRSDGTCPAPAREEQPSPPPQWWAEARPQCPVPADEAAMRPRKRVQPPPDCRRLAGEAVKLRASLERAEGRAAGAAAEGAACRAELARISDDARSSAAAVSHAAVEVASFRDKASAAERDARESRAAATASRAAAAESDKAGAAMAAANQELSMQLQQVASSLQEVQSLLDKQRRADGDGSLSLALDAALHSAFHAASNPADMSLDVGEGILDRLWKQAGQTARVVEAAAFASLLLTTLLYRRSSRRLDMEVAQLRLDLQEQEIQFRDQRHTPSRQPTTPNPTSQFIYS